jgi:urea carboxylase
MIYKEPRILTAGDRYLIVEFGTEINLRLNMMALRLSEQLSSAAIPGVLETLPMFVTCLVHFDPTVLDRSDLVEICRKLGSELAHHTDDIEWPSRLIEIPVCYGDPWTRECVADYRRTIKPDHPDDIEFVVGTNGLSTIEELVRRHSTTQHWVGGVGFWPGLPDMMPLDPRSRLSVAKYDPPRVWTPPGAIGVGGGFTSIYPLRTPGGYRLIGRTPVPIYDLSQKLPPFSASPVLFRPGDRVLFRPISLQEYERLTDQIQAGRYEYNIIEYEIVSLRRYEQWAERIAKQ